MGHCYIRLTLWRRSAYHPHWNRALRRACTRAARRGWPSRRGSRASAAAERSAAARSRSHLRRRTARGHSATPCCQEHFIISSDKLLSESLRLSGKLKPMMSTCLDGAKAVASRIGTSSTAPPAEDDAERGPDFFRLTEVAEPIV